jgi:DNA polymerase-3 subunit beta
VLPGAAPKSRLVGVARGALRDGLRRVLLMAGDTASAVTLELSADRLRLSARTPDLGEATDEVACTYAGEARELRVNGRYLAELVNAETVDALTLHVGEDELSPVMVVPDGASGVQHVVMPMRG